MTDGLDLEAPAPSTRHSVAPRRTRRMTVEARRRIQSVSAASNIRLRASTLGRGSVASKSSAAKDGKKRRLSHIAALTTGRRSTVSYAPVVVDEKDGGGEDGSPDDKDEKGDGDTTDSKPIATSLLNSEIATRREVWGWYWYDWSNGPFFYSVLNFLPLLLVLQAGSLPEGCIRRAECDVCNDCDDCTPDGKPLSGDLVCGDTVSPLGFGLNYKSFALYCTTVSVFFQLVAFMCCGGIADFGNMRKKLFVILNTIAAGLCILCIAFGKVTLYWANALILIFANVLYGICVIFYNAYLPLLVQSHYEVVADAESGDVSEEDLAAKMEATSNSMSVRGFAFGFGGQVVILTIDFAAFLLLPDNPNLAIRINVMIAGIWSILFSAIAFSWLKPRPGPPLPAGKSYLTYGFVHTFHTLKTLKQLPQLGIFLVAYFIYSDGHSTIGQAAAIFATTELKMSQAAILIGLLEVSLLAVPGAFIFLFMNRKGVPAKYIVLVNIALLAFIPLYGVIALKQQFEFYILAAIFGLNTGSLQAFTRSVFSEMIPEGHEAEYFSFYEVTDKGTAWLGPLTVAVVNEVTGNYRLAFLAIIVFFFVGGAILCVVKPEKGQQQARDFVERERAAKKKEEGEELTQL